MDQVKAHLAKCKYNPTQFNGRRCPNKGCNVTFNPKTSFADQRRHIERECLLRPNYRDCPVCDRHVPTCYLDKHRRLCAKKQTKATKVGEIRYDCKDCRFWTLLAWELKDHIHLSCLFSKEAKLNLLVCKTCFVVTVRRKGGQKHKCRGLDALSGNSVIRSAVWLSNHGWRLVRKARVAMNSPSGAIKPDFQLLEHPDVKIPARITVLLQINSFRDGIATSQLELSKRGGLIHAWFPEGQSLLLITLSSRQYIVDGVLHKTRLDSRLTKLLIDLHAQDNRCYVSQITVMSAES